MQKLLLVAQKVDQHDDLLGFFVDWIKEFQKYAHVKVIALKKPWPRSKIFRWTILGWNMLWAIPRCDLVFVHMSPLFAVLAGPWAWLWRKPIYVWYLHRSTTWKLRLAEKFATKIFTASAESLTLKSKKIIAVGHGINIQRFATSRTWNHPLLRIISVGRISPIKNYETLLATGRPVKIIGRPVMPGDDDYYMKLKQMGNAEFVFIPHTQIPEEYAQADLLVNCSPTGGLDKAVLEAMAAGCIVLVANKAFAPYLPPECLFEYGNVKDLSEKIKAIDSLSPQEKSILSNKLVTSVTEYHSLSTTIAKILAT